MTCIASWYTQRREISPHSYSLHRFSMLTCGKAEFSYRCVCHFLLVVVWSPNTNLGYHHWIVDGYYLTINTVFSKHAMEFWILVFLRAQDRNSVSAVCLQKNSWAFCFQFTALKTASELISPYSGQGFEIPQWWMQYNNTSRAEKSNSFKEVGWLDTALYNLSGILT